MTSDAVKKKDLLWIPGTKDDLMDMPDEIRTNFGYGLYQAQIGGHPDIAKPLTGFGGASVLELVEDHQSGTYRAVYTVKFEEAIVILHVFQKKSKRNIKTPKQDIDLIHERLKWAKVIYQEWKKKKDSK